MQDIKGKGSALSLFLFWWNGPVMACHGPENTFCMLCATTVPLKADERFLLWERRKARLPLIVAAQAQEQGQNRTQLHKKLENN